jgi:hypothetical protein
MEVNLSVKLAGARPGTVPGVTTSDNIIPYDERAQKIVTRQTLESKILNNN